MTSLARPIAQPSPDHEEMEPVQFFKHAIDRNGQFKIFRYCDD